MSNHSTTDFDNLKKRFLAIAGLSSIETTDSAFFRQSVNRRIRTAYERYPWPDFTIIGEPVTLFQDATHNPPSDVQDDNIIRTYGVYVNGGLALAHLDFDADVVFRVHKQNPTITRYPDEYTFISILDTRAGSVGYPAIEIVKAGDEIGKGESGGTQVFVTYRKSLDSVIRVPTYNAVTSQWEFAYDSGFYGNPSEFPDDNPNVPYTFFEYAAFGAYSDFLRGDGQTEKAQIEDQNAEMILRSEIDKVRNQSRQFRHDILQYRPSSQFRRHNVQAGGQPLNGTNLDNNVQ